MTLFITLTVLLIGLAVLIVTLPLLRSAPKKILSPANNNLLILKEHLQSLEQELQAGLISQEDFLAQKIELEKRTIQDVVQARAPLETTQFDGKWLNYFFILGIPIAVVGLYFILGNPAALYIKKDPQLIQIEEMVSQLESKLKEEPNNAQGWMFLGRTYAAMNRLEEAKIAYQKSIKLDPKNDDLFADLADLVSFQKKAITEEAQNYIQQALTINPKNPKALALKGTYLFDQKKYLEAIKAWNLAIGALGPKDQAFIDGLKASIQDAKNQINGVPSNTNQALAHLTGKVSIASKLSTKVAPTDTVFIYAKAVDGPKMPLAILRFAASELPRSFDLNDQQAMSAQMSISQFKEFNVLARVSKTGQAIPQHGDLIGEFSHVQLGAKNLNLVIDRVQP